MATAMFIEEPYEDSNGNIVMKHYDDIGSRGDQVAASYEFYKDKECKLLIDATYFNTNPKYFKSWSSPLPTRPEDKEKYGDYYADLPELYCRGKIYCGHIPDGFVESIPDNVNDEMLMEMISKTDGAIYSSDWTSLAMGTMCYQEVKFTEDGKITEETNSKELDLVYKKKG